MWYAVCHAEEGDQKFFDEDLMPLLKRIKKDGGKHRWSVKHVPLKKTV